MNRAEVIDLLQVAHDKYFRLLMENYPTIKQDAIFADFGPPELLDFAIEAHACVIALGPTALRRMQELGFDVLYPFDNPVDLYNWRQSIRDRRTDHSIYASIAIRIDSELKRIRRVLELDAGEKYDALDDSTFLVSKNRYKHTKHESIDRSESPAPPSPGTASVHIEHLHVNNPADKSAVNGLESLESKSTIWSNFSNIIVVIRTLFGA